MRTKKTADVYLACSGLDWVIVRPGLLTDRPGDGLVSAGMAVEYGEVSRDHVAMFIEAALHEPKLNHIIVELTDGPEPLEQAVAHLASAR